MASYFSIAFLFLFLPAALGLYAAVPRRRRWIVLLLASYLFFWFVSGALIGFVVASTVVVYACGRVMAAQIARRDALLAESTSGKRAIKKDARRRMRLVLAAGVLVNLGILFALKYLSFFTASLARLLAPLGVSLHTVSLGIGLPIGISFYTLMAVSYLVDVYRETVEADRNLARVALFLCFFPQVMEGPICRYDQTAHALFEGADLGRRQVFEGSVRMLFGIAKKVVVADRLNLFVGAVFSNHAAYDGGVIAVAAIAYTVQLYCDFSGTMDVALGIARMFGISLPENFRQPFFSKTASGFWKRWHITLGTWFKDYVYYPISLSRPCKALTSRARRRIGPHYGPILVSSIALFCVWAANGLWHGAGTQYLLFGMYYFVLIMLGGLVEPLSRTLCERLHVDREGRVWRAFQSVRTILVVFAGELLFRANDAQTGIAMLGRILTSFSLDSIATGSLFDLGMDRHDLAIVCAMLLLMLVVGVLRERGAHPLELVSSRGAVVRWGVWVVLVLLIIVCGAYGAHYQPVAPMYAQF